MGEARRTRGLQRGPRSRHVIEAVRAATIAELARVGVQGLKIEAVAQTANVSRTTIYRRWPSKASLVAAAVEPAVERFDQDRDTGSLEGDLLALMLLLRDTLTDREGKALAALGETVGLPEMTELNEQVRTRTLAPWTRAFDRARARAEIAATEDADVVIHLATYGVATWARVYRHPPSEAECRRILRVLLASLDAAATTSTGT